MKSANKVTREVEEMLVKNLKSTSLVGDMGGLIISLFERKGISFQNPHSAGYKDIKSVFMVL